MIIYSLASYRAFYLDKSNSPPNSTSKAAYVDKVKIEDCVDPMFYHLPLI